MTMRTRADVWTRATEQGRSVRIFPLQCFVLRHGRKWFIDLPKLPSNIHPGQIFQPPPPGGRRAALSPLWHRERQLWAASGSPPPNLGATEGGGVVSTGFTLLA